MDGVTHENAGDEPADHDRAARLAQRRGWRRRAALGFVVGAVIAGGAVGAYALVVDTDGSATADGSPSGNIAAAAPTTVKRSTTTAKPTTTTTTVPRVKQPKDYDMPSPGGGLGSGARSPIVALYETRMQQLHFDPGPVDGVFDQRTWHAVVAVQKYYNQPRTGVIDEGVREALSKFRYSPAEPNSERDRVEIDLDRQVLTLFWGGQPVLVTSTSTGNGDYFCGGADGCQYAVTPTGQYHFYFLHKGWQKGKLGTMWNPYYFNGSIAVHGLESVPAEPASHGCARIPMHVADYFYTLVREGMSVFVVGTQQPRGDQYVGPSRNRPSPPTNPPVVIPVFPAQTTTPAGTTPPATKPPATTPPTVKPTVPPTPPPTTG